MTAIERAYEDQGTGHESRACANSVHLDPVERFRALHSDVMNRVLEDWELQVDASLVDEINGVTRQAQHAPEFDLGYLHGQGDALGLPLDELFAGRAGDGFGSRGSRNAVNPGEVAGNSSTLREHYTPPEIVELAHAVLGGIDLDPASCAVANTVVEASQYYTKETNGFSQTWTGRVFLNPPGGRCDIEGRQVLPGCHWTGACGGSVPHEHRGIVDATVAWWRKLASDYESGLVESAMFIGVSLDILQRAQGHDGPTPLDFPFVIPRREVRFLSLSGDTLVPGERLEHGSAIVFLPPRGDQYASSAQLFLNRASELGQARWVR